MNESHFEEYLLEFESEGIGNLIYGLITKIVSSTVINYPAPIYSNAGTWDDEAIEDMVQDFIIKWLYPGRLAHYFLATNGLEDLSYGIRSELRKFLTSYRRRTEYINLFGRVKKILKETPQLKLKGGNINKIGSTIWSLSELNSLKIAQEIEDIIKAMYLTPVKRLIYRVDSKYSSPIISTDDLEKLLINTFKAINANLRFNDIMDALRYRLNLLEVGTINFSDLSNTDAVIEQEYQYAAPESISFSNKEGANQIFEMLSDRQRKTFYLRFSDDEITIEELTLKLNISKGTLYNELQTIQDILQAYVSEDEEAEQIISMLIALCENHSSKLSKSQPDQQE